MIDPNEKVIRVSQTQLHERLADVIDFTNNQEMENNLTQIR